MFFLNKHSNFKKNFTVTDSTLSTKINIFRYLFIIYLKNFHINITTNQYIIYIN